MHTKEMSELTALELGKQFLFFPRCWMNTKNYRVVKKEFKSSNTN